MYIWNVACGAFLNTKAVSTKLGRLFYFHQSLKYYLYNSIKNKENQLLLSCKFFDMKNKYIDLIVRFSAYSVLILIAIGIFRFDAVHVHNGLKFSEYSMTEFYQEVLYMLASIMFFITAVKFEDTRPISILAGGFTMVCFCREFDYLTDFIGSSFWGITAGIVMITVFLLSWKTRKNFTQSFVQYYNTKAFVFMICGMLVTFLFSRLYGKGDFWKTIMEENYIRSVKNAAEECIELLGDIFIFISSAEYLLFNIQKKRNSLTE